MKTQLLLLLIAPALGGAELGDGWCVAKLQSLEYPVISRSARMSGTVRLQAHIATDGSVGETRIISGNKILSKAAQDNLKNWRFMRCSLPGDDAAGGNDDVEIVYEFKLAGETRSTPKSQFSYERPYHITVTSAAPHWTP